MPFREEIARAYRVLGTDKGYLQNYADIQSWWRVGYITATEKEQLSAYNRAVYAKRRLYNAGED